MNLERDDDVGGAYRKDCPRGSRVFGRGGTHCCRRLLLSRPLPPLLLLPTKAAPVAPGRSTGGVGPTRVYCERELPQALLPM